MTSFTDPWFEDKPTISIYFDQEWILIPTCQIMTTRKNRIDNGHSMSLIL